MPTDLMYASESWPNVCVSRRVSLSLSLSLGDVLAALRGGRL